MTPEEILTEMKSDSPLNCARKMFSSCYAEIEQAGMQRVRPTILEYREMEFEAVKRILKAYGITVSADPNEWRG